jgi:serine/threonine protein kinase
MTIGRYQITREIARSNDIVYEAFDPQLGRKLALKELSLDVRVQEPERRLRIDRFFREARAAGNLSHPGIVTIFDFGEDNGRYFIAMEYLEGETLKSRIARTGPLPTDEAIRILSALCDAVEYAHARQIVHRDIKPDNIHILPDGSVKITDFGIARMLGEQTITVAGQVFGTPSYMAPEQIRGAMVDARTDIFSLGLVLFEMLSGRKAFWGEALETVVYRIMSEPVPPLHDQPASMNAVIQQAVQKDPGQRFVSAAQMKAALTGGVVSGVGGFARQPQTGWQAADRTVMASSAMANQAASMAADRTRMAPQTTFTPPSQPVPVQAPMQAQASAGGMSGNRVFVAVIGVVVVLIGLGIGAIALRSKKNAESSNPSPVNNLDFPNVQSITQATPPIQSQLGSIGSDPSQPFQNNPGQSDAQMRQIPPTNVQGSNYQNIESPQFVVKDEEKAREFFEAGEYAERQGQDDAAKQYYSKAAQYSIGGPNGIAEQALARISNLTLKQSGSGIQVPNR